MSLDLSKYFTVLVFFISPLATYSHEGHDKVPGGLAAPHGGIIQASKTIDWELTQDPTVKIYPYAIDKTSKELRAVPLTEIKLTASFKVHNGKKPKVQSAKLEPQGDFFILSEQINNKYPVTLEINFEYSGKKEKVQFHIDPQE